MIQFTAGMIRMLRGAPISVLLALSVAKQPVQASWLEGVTGYGDRPVLDALRFLKEMGLATRNSRYAWQLADGIEQLPLMVPELPEEDLAETEDPQKMRLALNASPASVVVVKQTINTQEDTSTTNNGADPQKMQVDGDLVIANMEALKLLDIKEPKRSVLARLSTTSPRQIRYIATYVAAARSARNPTGLAISLIERGSQPPEDWIDPGEEVPEPPPEEGEPEPLEELTPLSDVQRQVWDAAVAGLPINHAERVTWLPQAPSGISPGGEMVLHVLSRFAADWIHDHVLAALQQDTGYPIRIILQRNGGQNALYRA